MVKSLLSHADEHLKEFRREIDLLGRANHEHVVRLLGLCREMDPLFIITEYCDWVSSPSPPPVPYFQCIVLWFGMNLSQFFPLSLYCFLFMFFIFAFLFTILLFYCIFIPNFIVSSPPPTSYVLTPCISVSSPVCLSTRCRIKFNGFIQSGYHPLLLLLSSRYWLYKVLHFVKIALIFFLNNHLFFLRVTSKSSS